MRFKRVAPVIVVLLFALSIYEFLFSARLVPTFVEGNIEAGVAKRLFTILSVHSGEEHYVKCGGHVYFHVRGLEPFYLSVPGTRLVIFVTETADRSTVFHLFNTNTLTEIEIPGDKSNFGSNIGGSANSGDAYTDFVEKTSGDEIVLATQYPEFKKLTFLDLKHKRVERVESESKDQNGNIQRHVY